ncbi:transposase [Nostoc commune NIES-4072]|uniref:Transposase n=1 Tax=Nostoc commune NIES-4072 TaxID=2005467 RepID=A0A2R5FIG3_NOSCO|nr:transposase [Nostoc commune HK-02]GBG17739.1 transposase [Nostoc commune NIES-4072]
MYGCQQNLVNPNNELRAVLEFICSESHKFRTYAKIAKKLNFSNRQDAKSAKNS